ncbi:TonB-dependent receptor plug domain-containing protein [Neotamlana nanhaiensis]|nr:TonB-dependent receptor [Tamlana nanhaiensis]
MFSQVVKQDSTKIEQLSEVVVTGQLKPQSIKKSVFEVKVITREDIDNRAGNNLADLLNQTLNIDVFQNASNGRSEINVLGLGARYFKVLIDNIPVINEEGFGNSTDLTLINLNDVERIELVQGAMGVQYGANAMSGVLNIITKKKSKNDWEINTFIQEETVGDEYELFDKGRHIQSVSVGHQITDKNFISATYNRNDFAGFYDNFQGEYYDANDSLRGYRWLPKTQNFGKFLISHKGENFTAFYKFDYLHEDIFKHDSIVAQNYNSATDTRNPSALDETFNNQRFLHHLNVSGRLGEVPYSISASYQKQENKRESYTYYIHEDRKDNVSNTTYLSKDVLFSRGTFSNLINQDKFKLQAGYEYNREMGFGSSFSVNLAPGEEGVSKTLNNLDVFTSAEIDFNKDFSVKPGIRASFNDKFNTQYYYSLSARHLFKNNWEARGVLGFGTRTPTFDELYRYFVDVNHDVQGNENLNPEEGLSAFFHLKKQSRLAENVMMNNKLTFSYIDVKDRIDMVVVNDSPLQFQFNNIDDFSSLNLSLENSFYFNNLSLGFGASYFGINRTIDYDTNETSDRQDNFQVNANATYTIPKADAIVTAYFKHIGETNRFVQNGDGSFQTQTINPYSWLDVNLRKFFCKKQFEATFGVRNLLDTATVNTNAVSGGAHSGTSSNITLGYGRSYFLKLAYNLNI